MKRLDCSGFDSAALLDACVGQLDAQDDKDRFTDARDDLVQHYAAYVAMAGQHTLFSAQSFLHGNTDQIVCGAISKGDLTGLYSHTMVGKDGQARKVYDRLMALPAHSNCPYCGLGQVFTLDHFLAKSRYPQFSVLCENLIACCETCNKTMSGGLTTVDNIALHPYFEDAAIENTTWLTASLNETAPASVSYSVAHVDAWSPELARRVRNHFGQLNLAGRYAVAAANELASNVDVLCLIGSPADIQSHLAKWAQGLTHHSPNSWKAALYRALATSAWYAEGGYGARA
jgi:hypothetical protein